MPPAEKLRGLFFCVLRVGSDEPTLCFLYQLIATIGGADTRLEKPTSCLQDLLERARPKLVLV